MADTQSAPGTPSSVAQRFPSHGTSCWPGKALGQALNFVSGFHDRDGGKTWTQDGFSCSWRGGSSKYFNFAAIATQASIDRKTAERAAQLLRSRLPDTGSFLIYSGEPSAPVMHGLFQLSRSDVVLSVNIAAMDQPVASSSRIEVSQAIGEAGSRAIAELWTATSASPVELSQLLVNSWFERAVAFIVYVDGQPVSLAAVVRSRDTLYLSGVVTLPAAQGRGYASLACRVALLKAREITGIQEASVDSVPQGLGLYEQLGFQRVAYRHSYRLVGA